MIKFPAYLTALAMSIAVVQTASAAETKDFDRAAFAAAQAEGRPILIDVKAWWCPVCASQSSTIKKAVTAANYSKLVIFNVDFDKQKDVLKSFAVTKQATLIAFRGKRQTGRLDFVTDKTQINNLLASAVR
jgi:thioredoxin 1